MGILDRGKQLLILRKIQSELRNTTVEAERLGGLIKITMNGEFRPQEIKIDPSLLSPEKAFELEKGLKEAFNEAIGKAQQITATKMREMGSNLGIPGI